MPFSSCTRDQEKLNDVIDRVRALSNTVDELRAEVNAIKMSSFLRPDSNTIELLALQQFEKTDRGSSKSALSKFKRYFKKRKLLKQKPESYYYQENQFDVFTPSSGKYYDEKKQEMILSQRSSPSANALNDQFGGRNAEVIRQRESKASSAPKEFSESRIISESSTASIDPREYNPSLRVWKISDTGDAREKNKKNGRRYLKIKKSRSKRDTKKNVKARFSTKEKYEPTSSSEVASSQLSDDDIPTERDSVKYERSVTFIDRRRKLPKINAQRSQTSSVSVISTEDPDLDMDYNNRVKQSKNAWKVPIKSKLKNRIKRRSSSILRPRKTRKMKRVNCGTNCPYFKDVHVDNSTDHQVSIAIDTIAMPRLTEHRKTQTESDVNKGRREEVPEKKASRQNRKAKCTRVAKVSCSKSESSSSDGQGLNSKRKSCCPFKKGSSKQAKHISSNFDSESVESSASSDVNAKFPIDKRPIINSQSSTSNSERSTDSADSREGDFGIRKDIGVSIQKCPKDIDKIRESKIQRRSNNLPTSYDTYRVANKPSRRRLSKIEKKRTETPLPDMRNLPDNTSGIALRKPMENLKNSQPENMYTIYPQNVETHGERVHGKESFSKKSKKHRTTKKPNSKKKLDESWENRVLGVSTFTSPSERNASTASVGSEEKIFEKKEQIEKSKKDERNRYDSQKYPTRINVQPHVYQASYMHQNERPFVKDSLSTFPRKSSEYIYSQSALVDIKTSDNSCYNSKNEPSENPFTDTLLFIENQPGALLDSGLRMTEISNRLYNCLYRLDHIIA